MTESQGKKFREAVLVEKPLTLKYEQSEKLVNLAMKKELKLEKN